VSKFASALFDLKVVLILFVDSPRASNFDVSLIAVVLIELHLFQLALIPVALVVLVLVRVSLLFGIRG
jgi:hypothetical protein